MCDPDALFQMALAENHRNALKMEAAAVAANNNTTNIPIGGVHNTSTGAQLLVGNGGLNSSGNQQSQHATVLQHPQHHHAHHSRLHQHHSTLDPPHASLDDELGAQYWKISDQFRSKTNKNNLIFRKNYDLYETFLETIF